MVSICFYFQVHQPYRLKKYGVFDIGNNGNYFDEAKNQNILRKVAGKCYIPATEMLIDTIYNYPEFKVAFSFTGVVLEQFEKYAPEVLGLFQELVETGNVEILDETYHHSLSFLYSKKEFKKQIKMHNRKIKELFNCKPKVFRNTELIYNNELAKFIEDMGYKGILAEGADYILGWRSPNFVYKPINTSKISLLLRNYKLSDDIAFRFSSRSWKEWPMTAEKYAHWISAINGSGEVVNLFMDYETIGEHQWQDTGIFDFFKRLPGKLLKHPNNNFKTPTEIVNSYKPVAELDIHNIVSWADIERDLSAWLGNKMQQTAVSKIYEIEKNIKKTKDTGLINDWRNLQISDNFYYMCTKWFSDGDVHKYFNPYDTPHDSFTSFMNILTDIELRLKEKNYQKIGGEQVEKKE